jgi:hypothetical protein
VIAADECTRAEVLMAARAEGGLGSGGAELLDDHLAKCARCRAVADTLSPIADVDGDHASLPVAPPGAYALGQEIARGGMGRILAARDLRIGRPVAIKELLHRSATLARRFEREARVTARLQHPGILPVYEIGTWPDGTPFYVMREVHGRTLREAIAGASGFAGRLALLPATITACETVAFAHAGGVIHRDLSPSNVLVGEYGETVVIDWGLAKHVGDGPDEPGEENTGPYRSDAEDAALTAAGTVLGTAAYMPPEQSLDADVDARADVYALGAVLYHLLAGFPPYRGSAETVLEELRRGPPLALAQLWPNAPRALVSIVDKAMARDRADRYANAGELASELRRFEAGRLVDAHPYTATERTRRWIRRHPAVVAALAAVAIAGSVAVVGVVRERDRADAARARTQVMLAALYEESGRFSLEAGHGWQAAAALGEAYRLGRNTPTLRYLLARAMADVDAVDLRLPFDETRRNGTLGLAPDGSRLLLATAQRVQQFRVSDGAALATILVQAEEGVDFAEARYSDDGARILVRPLFGTPSGWDAATGERLATFDERELPEDPPRRHDDDVVAREVSRLGGRQHVRARDVDRFAFFAVDGSIVVMTPRDPAVRPRFDLAAHGIERLVALDGGRVLGDAADGTLHHWDPATGVELPLPPPVETARRSGRLRGIAFGESHVAICDHAGNATVHDLASGTASTFFDDCEGPVEISRDGRTVVFGRHVFRGEALSAMAQGPAAIDASGARLASGSGTSIWVEETVTRRFGFDVESDTPVTSLALSPDGVFVATARGVWAVNGRKMNRPWLDVDPAHARVSYAADGAMLWIAEAGVVTGWDTHLETRSPDEIVRLIHDRTPFWIEGDNVVYGDHAAIRL